MHLDHCFLSSSLVSFLVHGSVGLVGYSRVSAQQRCHSSVSAPKVESILPFCDTILSCLVRTVCWRGRCYRLALKPGCGGKSVQFASPSWKVHSPLYLHGLTPARQVHATSVAASGNLIRTLVNQSTG